MKQEVSPACRCAGAERAAKGGIAARAGGSQLREPSAVAD
jgi:hypothetical protein